LYEIPNTIALNTTIYNRFGREPELALLWGEIFKHFIVNSDIGENDVIRAGEIKQHLSAFIKTAKSSDKSVSTCRIGNQTLKRTTSAP